MTNRYYYNDGFREFGPFSIQELLLKKIRPDYQLRLEGEESYTIAKEVTEVAQLFKAQFPQNSNAIVPNEFSSHYNQEPSYQNHFERDMSFEQQDFNPNIEPHIKNTSTSNWRELLLIGVLAFWLVESMVHWIMTILSIDAWFGPGRIVSGFVSVLFAFIPILIAICIRQSHLKIIAIIIGSILTISMLSKQVYWTFQLF